MILRNFSLDEIVCGLWNFCFRVKVVSQHHIITIHIHSHGEKRKIYIIFSTVVFLDTLLTLSLSSSTRKHIKCTLDLPIHTVRPSINAHLVLCRSKSTTTTSIWPLESQSHNIPSSERESWVSEEAEEGPTCYSTKLKLSLDSKMSSWPRLPRRGEFFRTEKTNDVARRRPLIIDALIFQSGSAV